MKEIKTGLVRINCEIPGIYIRGDEAFLFAASLKHILDQYDLKNTEVNNQVFWYVSELYNLLARLDLSHREFNTYDVQVITTDHVGKKET